MKMTKTDNMGEEVSALFRLVAEHETTANGGEAKGAEPRAPALLPF